MVLKIIGIILALIGSILGVVTSLPYFYSASQAAAVVPHHDVQGLVIFIVSVLALLLSLFAFKYHFSKKLFITLVIWGVVLMLLHVSPAGLILLIGGVVGFIGAVIRPNRSPANLR